MAGAGYRQWATGQLVTAADAQAYWQDQTVMVFASSAARTAAITAPSAGMLTYLQDVGRYDRYTGSAWRPITHSEQITNGSVNAAWSGTLQATRVGGMLWLYVVLTASNALPSTWYDLGTFAAGFRPYGTVTGIPCQVSGAVGKLAWQAGGLLRVNTGPKHTAGATEVTATASVPHSVAVA
jgi:hypothetical protein